MDVLGVFPHTHTHKSCGVVQETEEPSLFVVVHCVLPSINNNNINNSTSIYYRSLRNYNYNNNNFNNNYNNINCV
ncbi:hypothetical protein Pcinc_019348 [Petrolisthes cinctipes]|uniref:Uncharacterized protein n=1 Tax=Petrolisthes cinctipes TaxID=88211 RepID=A0AAE1FL60_PETCI|nr:hypothetical protein Pcinc_019348 [Petrolisthes cinctipes]